MRRLQLLYVMLFVIVTGTLYGTGQVRADRKDCQDVRVFNGEVRVVYDKVAGCTPIQVCFKDMAADCESQPGPDPQFPFCDCRTPETFQTIYVCSCKCNVDSPEDCTSSTCDDLDTAKNTDGADVNCDTVKTTWPPQGCVGFGSKYYDSAGTGYVR